MRHSDIGVSPLTFRALPNTNNCTHRKPKLAAEYIQSFVHARKIRTQKTSPPHRGSSHYGQNVAERGGFHGISTKLQLATFQGRNVTQIKDDASAPLLCSAASKWEGVEITRGRGLFQCTIRIISYREINQEEILSELIVVRCSWVQKPGGSGNAQRTDKCWRKFWGHSLHCDI